MYIIHQRFQFCYGHRLLHHAGKCKRLHGHSATAEIQLDYSELQKSGMAIDFFEVKSTLGTWIDAELDHRMLLAAEDPLCAELDRLGEPYRKLDMHPTAENIARLIYDKAHALNLPVTAVTVWESDKSAATYTLKTS